MWASTCKTYVTKLRKLQNKAIKIITKTYLRERVSLCFYKLQILKLDDLYQFELAKLMYQFTLNKRSSRFCNYFAYSSDSYSYATRNSSNKSLQIPRFWTARTQKCFKYAGEKLWNNIPLNIKQLYRTTNSKPPTRICF